MCDRAKKPKLFNRLLKPQSLRFQSGRYLPTYHLFMSASILSDFVATLKLSLTSTPWSGIVDEIQYVSFLTAPQTLRSALTVTYSYNLPPSFPKPRNMVCRSGARPNHAASPCHGISPRRWHNELKMSNECVNVALQRSPKMHEKYEIP